MYLRGGKNESINTYLRRLIACVVGRPHSGRLVHVERGARK